jgi:carboxypeptidase Taq
MASLHDNYDQLLARYREMTILRTAGDVVYWDLETKMPPKGLELRSEQLSFIGLKTHQMITDPAVGKHLESIEKDPSYPSMNVEQKRNVHLLRKAYDEESKLPDSLVAEIAKQSILAVGAWKKAKAANDFAQFSPFLAKNIELKKQAAEILMKAKGSKNHYDALLDMFEPGMTAERINEVFTGMREGLIKILKRVDASPNKPDESFLSRKVAVEAQRKISLMAMEFIGYETSGPNAWGRLDETEHPFSNGYYTDVRITTHYHEDADRRLKRKIQAESAQPFSDVRAVRVQFRAQQLGADADEFGFHSHPNSL